jgi:hypothetical protein
MRLLHMPCTQEFGKFGKKRDYSRRDFSLKVLGDGFYGANYHS